MKSIQTNLRYGLFLVGVLAILPGCGGTAPPAAADPAQARDALGAALESWKAGEQPESLRQRKPAVVVVDHEWTAGYRLLHYEAGADQALGGNLRCNVVLVLRNPRGQTVRKKAAYSVGTSPVLTVHREDDL